MKRLICTLLAAASLAWSKPSDGAQSSAELMVGQDHATLDVKVSGKIAEDFGVFIRTRQSMNYDGTANSFGLFDLSYNLCTGLDAVLETQFFSNKLIPRVGVQYSQQLEDFNLYALLTGGDFDALYGEALFQIKFRSELDKEHDLFLSLEAVTDFTRKHEYSEQRIRAGLSAGDWNLGAGVDLAESARGDISYNTGLFLENKF